jgi:exopolyphosphatase/guanosine-5'-triphosphate,3'-diphosphate pyrophosphatase
MTERHFATDPVAPHEIELARSDIQQAIAQAGEVVAITKAKTVVAVAGTATTVAAAALALPDYDRYAIHLSRISAEQVHAAATMFATQDRRQRSQLGYMHPGRVDVIAAGSLVLSEIMKATGANEFVASESDILDGMAFSLASS